jgi:hypothetical protein
LLDRDDHRKAAGHPGSYQQEDGDNHIHHYLRPTD